MSATNTVGVVGLGIMGSAFSTHLLKSGFSVVGFDVLADKLAQFETKGGKVVGSPQEVAEEADIVLTSLPSVAAFHGVFSGDDGLAAAGNEKLIVLECSTLTIADKIAGRDAIAAAGGTVLDCPISGTGSQAAAKDISVYISGDEDAYKTVVPVIEGFSRSQHYVGEFGNGSKMKFVANHLVHIHNVATAEAMVLGMKAGLDPQTIYDVIRDGAGNSRIFELRGPMMVKNNYDAVTMKMSVWQKDMDVIGDFAKEIGSPTPMFDAGVDIYLKALADGLAEKDTAAVCAVLEDMAGLKRSS
ncbi:MAG: NAD(P)-dependent oxidoreductase [Proteobacteria bacterium]|nr:NAD(P)-dependent oxidoreductase [Pseudomonadota bacterium]